MKKIKKESKLRKKLLVHYKYLEFLRYIKSNLIKLNPVILDLETTGIRRNDEILQVSIIDFEGKKVFDRYIKPRYVNEWDRAYKIHNISLKDVENKKDITHYRREIEKILKKYKLVVGYELGNDINYLKKAKIDISNTMFLDIAYLFKRIFENENISDKLTPSLVEAASYYNYQFKPHNSLEDCKATLHCFKNLLLEDENKFELKYDKSKILEIKEEKKESKLKKMAKKYIDIFESYSNKIVLDLETTGIREEDEIIQLSIMDLDKNILFNEYIKPSKVEEWKDAYKIHKISKEMLNDKKKLEDYKVIIQDILNKTDYMIGYGIKFDYDILKRAGFNVEHIKKIDISEYFKYLYRKILNDPMAKRPKLIECASYYGFKENDFHNSLTDCRATLLAYNFIYKDMLEEVMKNE